VLAHEKIGISRNYIYASSLRQQLEPALEELKEKGTLSEYEFIGKGKTTEVVLVAAHAPRRTLATTGQAAQGSKGASSVTVQSEPRSPERVSGDASEGLIQALTQRGLAEKQVRRLVLGQGAEALARMKAIVAHFDKLVSSGSHLVSRNPQGFLYRAVEKPFDFMLPGEKGGARAMQGQGSLQFSAKEQAKAREDEKLADTKKRMDSLNLEVAYLTERKEALDLMYKSADPHVVSALHSEVEQALAKLRAHISPQRFAEAVQHGVEQRLLEQGGFPDFDAWCRES